MTKWVIVKDSFLTSEILGTARPRKLLNGQYLVRVNPDNEKFFLGLKRHSKEELFTLDLNSVNEFEAREEVVEQQPFNSKTLRDGRKLFRRHHGYVKELVEGPNPIDILIEYDKVKISEIEFIGTHFGETVNFYIMAGETVLNQFGFNVNMKDGDTYDNSKYDADLVKGLTIRIEYTAILAREIRINIPFHEVK